MIDQSVLSETAEATHPSKVGKKAETKKAFSWVSRIMSPFSTLLEFAQLTRRTGRALWLVPMMGVLSLLAVVLVFVQIVEYVAPFVYTIF